MGKYMTRARTLALHARPEPESELSYLQLRNRRLEKPPLTKPNKARPSKGRFGHFQVEVDVEVDVEASFGENDLEFDRERSTRESTPCSLIRTPGSATRPTYSNRSFQNAFRGAIPTTPEMEEFFAGFELHQRQLFLEKYNYDIMNDLPLPGRYEWAANAIQVDN